MDNDKRTSKFSFAMKVTVPDQVLTRDLDDETMLLNLNSELYLGLNSTGSQILKVLSQSGSIEEALVALLAKYDIGADRLRTELSKFIDKLLEHGLIELSEP